MRQYAVVSGLDYDLHKLGWRAFQDLCAVILQQVLGQTFHAFADTNDAGRDGAFHGRWAAPGDALTGRTASVARNIATVVQCKFSGRRDTTLTPAMLSDEVSKIQRLHERGLCDAYLLLTNLRVTGRTDAWIAEQAAGVGVDQTLTLDGTWISQQITQSPSLRRYVPRVYGLGDLGKILDDRRLQAQALLARLREDLVTFVPTEAYRRAADAVAEHGFVLLLGEPAAGKSTIAATLAIAALDNWKCGVKRVDSAKELIDAWDPDEPSQLFWIDDAFGSIRHDPMLTDGWARRMDQVMTAVGQGARVILTSRDYIYRGARQHLKEYAYPLLREHQVVVDVTQLTPPEKRQILYNHLKAGDQPRKALESWRPHLRRAAEVTPFQPEVARRLAHRAFTSAIRLDTGNDVVAFFARPLSFLADVLRQLDAATRAALACVYLAGDELPSPVDFTPTLKEAVTRLGAVESEVIHAFVAADGTFLQRSQDSRGDPVWRFRHPTIREGFAAVVAEDTNTVSVFLDGLDDDEILHQIDCGGSTARGTLVRVPATLYFRVIPRVAVPEGGAAWLHPTAWFLEHRCSPEFLRQWSAHHAADLPRLVTFGMYVDAHWQPKFLARLHQAGALPESIRVAAVERLAEYALYLDAGWLDDPIPGLFTDTERGVVLDRIRAEILPNIKDHIDESADGYESDVEPETRYEEARKAVRAFTEVFKGEPAIVSKLAKAAEYIEGEIAEQETVFSPSPAPSLAGRPPPSTTFAAPTGRDEFEDVAEGR